MKKLVLMLMLVFGMASLASALPAGIQLSINGNYNGENEMMEITLAPCQTMVVDVWGPADYDWSAFVGIMGSFPGAKGEWGDGLGPPYTSMNGGYYYEDQRYPVVYPAAGDQGLAEVQRLEYADWGFGYMVTAASLTSVPGGRMFDLLYHCTGAGDVTIEIYDMETWVAVDSIVVHQVVPEPMTITLLGLGGLLLRRRK